MGMRLNQPRQGNGATAVFDRRIFFCRDTGGKLPEAAIMDQDVSYISAEWSDISDKQIFIHGVL
jgi:hypothetical protein